MLFNSCNKVARVLTWSSVDSFLLPQSCPIPPDELLEQNGQLHHVAKIGKSTAAHAILSYFILFSLKYCSDSRIFNHPCHRSSLLQYHNSHRNCFDIHLTTPVSIISDIINNSHSASCQLWRQTVASGWGATAAFTPTSCLCGIL
jgi:hypothetical protein